MSERVREKRDGRSLIRITMIGCWENWLRAWKVRHPQNPNVNFYSTLIHLCVFAPRRIILFYSSTLLDCILLSLFLLQPRINSLSGLHTTYLSSGLLLFPPSHPPHESHDCCHDLLLTTSLPPLSTPFDPPSALHPYSQSFIWSSCIARAPVLYFLYCCIFFSLLSTIARYHGRGFSLLFLPMIAPS